MCVYIDSQRLIHYSPFLFLFCEVCGPCVQSQFSSVAILVIGIVIKKH